jgi:nickel-dependent lactate racemase
MDAERHLRTGVWYGDLPLHLDFPRGWDVRFLWPRTPPPLTDQQICEALEHPVGQPPLRELCRGKLRPLILVDDLNRPTRVFRVLPFVLQQFEDAGIPSRNVTILMAGGTHGLSPGNAIHKKVGPLAAESCRLVVHDPRRRAVKVGRTSFGTPVLVNHEVVASDFVMGIGGLYPNSTVGFGGATKIALGALQLAAISYLHHRHRGAGRGAFAIDGSFRQDLNEVARTIGLRSTVTVHLNAGREVVRVAAGDPQQYYPQEETFAREAYRAPFPDEADVVISNAFPNDLSFTFVWMKGIAPVRRCPVNASRIVIGSCSEGMGSHGVYPVVNPPRFHARRDHLRRLRVMGIEEISRKITNRLSRIMGGKTNGASRAEADPKLPNWKNPIWLYRPGSQAEKLPPIMRGIHIRESWPEIVSRVQNEQGDRDALRVFLYTCAPLQFLERFEEESADSSGAGEYEQVESE